MSTPAALQIGLFFDGTGNNLHNADTPNKPFATGSYANARSNIAHLCTLYGRGANDLPIYVQGIGTTAGRPDSLMGQASGQGTTGVLARVAEVPALIRQRLALSGIRRPLRIELDIFGFSRGAAAARHCANLVQREGHAPLGPDTLQGVPIHVRFLGLFDTVAAVLPGTRLDLEIAPELARKTVHLVARDECREHFDLISAGSADIWLPGAHSDIGGGYPAQHWEDLWLHRPLVSHERRDRAVGDSRAARAREATQHAHCAHWDRHGFEYTPELWTAPLPVGGQDAWHKVFAVTRGQRQVLDGLARVHLRIMYERAIAAGVPLQPYALELEAPDELSEIQTRMLAYAHAKAQQPVLTQAHEALLYRRYIHCSSHWNPAGGIRSAERDTLFINRPAPDGRRIHTP